MGVAAVLAGAAAGGAGGYYVHLHRPLSAEAASLPVDQAAGVAAKRAAIYSAIGAGVGGLALGLLVR